MALRSSAAALSESRDTVVITSRWSKLPDAGRLQAVIGLFWNKEVDPDLIACLQGG